MDTIIPPLTKEQKDALYCKYFEKIENPAIIIQLTDGRFISQINQLAIPEEAIIHLGMGVIILQENDI